VDSTGNGTRIATMVDENEGYHITQIPATFGIPAHWLVTHVDDGEIGQADTEHEARKIAQAHFDARH
jgi:hypothetical protein